jgi:hypothetical protein
MPDQSDPALPYVYSFDPNDLTLYHDDQQGNLVPAGLAPGVVPASGPFVDGVRSGPLVTDPSRLAIAFDAWSLPLFYTWESGANPWNQWAGLQDATSGAFSQLDPPLQFLYLHSVSNDANGDPSQDGKEFLLEYRGEGQLLGIPIVKVDTDGDGASDHDSPLFSIADGTMVGPTGIEFVTKATRRELIFDPAGVVPPGLDPSLAMPYEQLIVPLIISGIGMGLFFAPVANVVLSAVRPFEEGQASGANNAIREVGGVFGVAVLASVFSAFGGYASLQDFVDGLQPAVLVGALVVAVGSVAAFAVPRTARAALRVDAGATSAVGEPEPVYVIADD